MADLSGLKGNNPSEKALQEHWLERQKQRIKKKEEIINKLRSDRSVNKDLGKRVEKNEIMFFECPPMHFDSEDEGQIDANMTQRERD